MAGVTIVAANKAVPGDLAVIVPIFKREFLIGKIRKSHVSNVGTVDQRIVAGLHALPEGVVLAAGMTGTVQIDARR